VYDPASPRPSPGPRSYQQLEKNGDLGRDWFRCLDSEALLAASAGRKRSAQEAATTNSGAVGNMDGSLVTRGSRTSAATKPKMLAMLREAIEGGRLSVHEHLACRVTRDEQSEEEFLGRLAHAADDGDSEAMARLTAGLPASAAATIRLAANAGDTQRLFDAVPNLRQVYQADQRRVALALFKAELQGLTLYKETKCDVVALRPGSPLLPSPGTRRTRSRTR
jgi:hypothetical protein